jgi:hypothetical protein
MLTFLSPLFLIGLLAAAIPLIIHLSRSRRTKKMRFSTTRFFTDQFLRSYRMSRLKEVLLLACRMALCALLAVALARPLLLPKGGAFLAGGSRSVVLVLDNSASMGVAEDGRTMLDRAKKAADDVLDTLGPNDTASVVLAGRRAGGPEVLFPDPVADREEVRRRVEAVQVAALGTDLSGAVARAEQIAGSRSESSREVYVLSDLQDSGWEMDDRPDRPAPDSEVAYFFVSVRPKAVSNLAVTAVQFGAARPMVGVPFSIRTHLTSQGEQTRPTSVRLYVDGEKVSERPLEKLQDGRWAAPGFHHTFLRGGWHHGYVEVDDDGLALDNRRYFAFEVLDSVKVLAVDGAPSDVPRLDELFFLNAALTAGPEGHGPIQVDTITAPSLVGTELSKYPLVILANVASLPEAAVEKLEEFVDRGGSLVVFLGDHVDPAFYNQTLAGAERRNGGLLPARLTALVGDPKGPDAFAVISEVRYQHPALSAFQDPRASLAGVMFTALWGLDADPTAVLMGARQVARAGAVGWAPPTDAPVGGAHPTAPDATHPLLCQKSYGKGRVLLFASTCDRDWTNFPVRPAYLPFVHLLVGYLCQEPAAHQNLYATGDAVPIPASAVEGLPRVQVKTPDGTVGYPTASDDPDQPLVFTDTAQPGVYHLMGADKKTGAGLIAVNLDNYESDLRYLDDVLADWPQTPDFASREAKIEAGFKQLLGGQPLVTYVHDPRRVADVALTARRGLKLWDVVLWVVLAIALVEPWLANRISLRHYARPKEIAALPPGRAARLNPRPDLEPQVQQVEKVRP